ncbi:MAG TPA: undecaprenyldiphospho-muramoylpentapeptide beta-N-acetylglucosaminyltransferase [Cyanobacteria bacterium UBA9971]|nr:undecaprenyldiphospho-muramoylpentapeptide beta-N-acetylglucosaminyltransferase [Cyanobacteria bacterium UBA9971]
MPTSGRKIKVLITGGGTGGHIFPAIAVAQKLKQDSDIEKIFYIGCKKNMEKNIVLEEKLDFYSINVSGMPRQKSLKLIKWFIELGFATIKSIYYISKLKPDVVFGTGGYVSGPVLLAAKILNIPFVIHDPDAHPGIVNKFMSKWASAVSISFEQAKSHLKSKNIILNGNPIRANFLHVNKENALKELNLSPNKKTILVIGGSQGAQAINNALLETVPDLINMEFQIIHQTGNKNYDKYIEELTKKHPELINNPYYIVKPFFNNIEIPLNAADLAVSRAGSLSISELNLCGLPSILVPYPYAAANHQKFNAKAMEEAGASIYLEDSQCNSSMLLELILNIFNNPEKIEQMQLANKLLAKPQATEDIIRILKEVATCHSEPVKQA